MAEAHHDLEEQEWVPNSIPSNEPSAEHRLYHATCLQETASTSVDLCEELPKEEEAQIGEQDELEKLLKQREKLDRKIAMLQKSIPRRYKKAKKLRRRIRRAHQAHGRAIEGMDASIHESEEEE